MPKFTGTHFSSYVAKKSDTGRLTDVMKTSKGFSFHYERNTDHQAR